MFAPDQVIIIIAAVGFMLMGVVAMVAPTRVTEQFDISMLSVNGRNEVRAVYGGFGFAIAAMLLTALYLPALRAGICLTIGAALAGMAVGRIISVALDRAVGRYPLMYGCIETVGAALLVYAALGFSAS
jgi:hypothetical protein